MTASSLLSALTFAALGIVAWMSAVALVLRVLPGNLWQQATEHHDVAAAVVVGALMIGLGIIIAAAVH